MNRIKYHILNVIDDIKLIILRYEINRLDRKIKKRGENDRTKKIKYISKTIRGSMVG